MPSDSAEREQRIKTQPIPPPDPALVRSPSIPKTIDPVANAPTREVAPGAVIAASSSGTAPTVASPGTSSETQTLPAVIAGRYEVEAVLGEGGMGAVFRVFDRELQRKAALKVIRGEKRDEKRERRFLLEARAMARLSHPACVQVFDSGVDSEGCPFLVMELVQGEPLADVVERGELSPRRAALVIHQIAGALACVHEAGLIHRDVKPQNILVGPQGAKLADFGIVKDEEVPTELTAAGAIVGTLVYMAPEQTGRTGLRVDARADVYALGATLYHCLAGGPPFMGNQQAVLHGVLNRRPASPRKVNGEVPRELEAIALRCLEKDRARRYRSAAELEADLARFLADEPIEARPPSILARVFKAARRHRRLVVVALAGAFAAAVVLSVFVVLARAEAGRELERAREALERGELDTAEGAFLKVAVSSGARAVQAHDGLRRVEAARRIASASASLRELERLEARARDALAALPGPDDPAERTRLENAASEAVVAARVELAAIERDLDGACGLAPDMDTLRRVLAKRAEAVAIVAPRDPEVARLFERERIRIAQPLQTNLGLPIEGRASFALNPRDARLRLERFVRDERGVAKVELVELPAGATSASLLPGDYRAVIERTGFFEARVPFEVLPGATVSLAVDLWPVAFGERGRDFVYVAPGEARSGEGLARVERCRDGFLLQKNKVRRTLWLEFARARRPADLARADAAAREQPLAPVTNVSPEDARELAAWYASGIRSELEARGWVVRLPSAIEVHRALRGPLRRVFAWGNVFSPSFIIAGSPVDESPVGALGLSSGTAELTRDARPDSTDALIIGSFEGDTESSARAAATGERAWLAAGARDPRVGLRLCIGKP